MPNNDSVLLICELDTCEAIDFLSKCEDEGVSVSEKIKPLVQNFLPQGDNHLLRKTA